MVNLHAEMVGGVAVGVIVLVLVVVLVLVLVGVVVDGLYSLMSSKPIARVFVTNHIFPP